MPFKTKYFCSECEGDFYVTTEGRPKGRCPSCPACKLEHQATLKSITQSRGDLEFGEKQREKRAADPDYWKGGVPGAPAKVFSMGGSNHSKAIDATAEIVMQDYQMTDINMNTTLRQGDNLVPKLAPELERKVDEVFKSQKPVMGMQQASNLNTTLTKQINAGVFKNYGGAGDVVARQQAGGYKVPVNIIHEHTGKGPSA